jgi:hypothetical protein
MQGMKTEVATDPIVEKISFRRRRGFTKMENFTAVMKLAKYLEFQRKTF